MRLIITLTILVLLNVVAARVYERFDLTTEKRFTLSGPVVSMLKNLDDVVYVKVYLEGEFPAGFKRLQSATEEMLYEFKNVSGGKLQYIFVNPSAGDYETRNLLYKELYDKGLKPTNLKVKGDQESSTQIIFPGLLMRYRDQEVAVQLLESQVRLGPEQVLNNSIELLEYKLANGIKKVTQNEWPRIGIIQGQGELPPMYMADFLTTLQESRYQVKLVDLPGTLTLVNKFETIIIAQPTQTYTEKEKFKIDQFVMNGGRVLWLLDKTNASMDSMRGVPFFMAQNLDVNLDDQLFRYGVRINQDLVQDLQNNPIPLVVSETNPPQTQLFPWPYFPVLTSYNTDQTVEGLPKPHVIAKNLDAVAAQFISTIDTIKVPGIEKTPLLFSSAHSKALMIPTRLHFGMLRAPLEEQTFNQKFLPVAYLLEGSFTSVFKNRLSAETMQVLQDSLDNVGFKESGSYSKMIVIADGDIIANEIGNDGQPYPLGYYPYTKQSFANRDLLLNCVEYLTDDVNLIGTRNREVKLRLLDKVKVKEEALLWQLLNTVVPVLAILLFGGVYYLVRRRRYAN